MLTLPLGREFQAGRRPRRPPLGIYNISLKRILDALLRVLRELRDVQELGVTAERVKNLGWFDPVLAAQHELLMAIQSHKDDCAAILKMLLMEEDYRSNSHVTAYWKARKGYNSFLDRVANHLKHHQGRLCPIVFYSPTNMYLGYYVEGVDSSGHLGPEPSIHKRGRGAFSFARDCRYHIVQTYLNAHELSKAITAVLGAQEACHEVEHNDTTVTQIIELLEQMPLVVYPDEKGMLVPRVESTLIGDIRIVSFSLKDDASARTAKEKSRFLRISVRWGGDGVTRDYRLPYKLSDHP